MPGTGASAWHTQKTVCSFEAFLVKTEGQIQSHLSLGPAQCLQGRDGAASPAKAQVREAALGGLISELSFPHLGRQTQQRWAWVVGREGGWGEMIEAQIIPEAGAGKC